MDDYIIYDGELYHHGRKGMKWGQHIFGKVKSGAKIVGKKSWELSKKAGKVGVKLSKKAYSKAKDAHNVRKAEKAAKKLRRKPIKDLTDDELKDRLKRLNLEKQVRDIEKQSPSTVSKGKEFMTRVGKEVLVPATLNASKEVLERWLKKQGYDFAGLKDTQYGKPEGWDLSEASRLKKETATNNKTSAQIEDWFEERRKNQASKNEQSSSDKNNKNNKNNSDNKNSNHTNKKDSDKNDTGSKKDDKKTYTGKVTGEGTSKRKSENKKSAKPNDYYDPIYTEFVNKTTASNVRSTPQYRMGLEYMNRLRLNAPKR